MFHIVYHDIWSFYLLRHQGLILLTLARGHDQDGKVRCYFCFTCWAIRLFLKGGGGGSIVLVLSGWFKLSWVTPKKGTVDIFIFGLEFICPLYESDSYTTLSDSVKALRIYRVAWKSIGVLENPWIGCRLYHREIDYWGGFEDFENKFYRALK